MRTLKQLREEVLRYFDLSDEPIGSKDVTLVDTALNTVNQQRATEDRWPFMRSNAYSLSVVAGTQQYILPHNNFYLLEYIWSTSKQRFLSQVPMREVPYVDVNFNNQLQNADNLYFDIIAGASVVVAQPASAGTVTVTSSDNTDVGDFYIEGEDANGLPISETLTLVAGTDTGSTAFTKITYYAKATDFNGTLTLTRGATTLVVLGPDEAGKEYPVLKFYNVPQENETMEYRFYRAPRVMTRDLDRPDLPFPHSALLVYDALLDLATYNELDSESVNIWRDKQQQLLMNLYSLKLDGNSIAGTSTYIHESDVLGYGMRQ